MTNSEINIFIPSLEISFSEEVERTYVMRVEIDNSTFEVNCQTGMNDSYKETVSLTCRNDSGGDYYDSGLDSFIDENYKDNADQIHDLLRAEIESCANCFTPENTVEAHLLVVEDIEVIRDSKDGIFGACHAYNCSMSRYNEIDGERVVIVAEDSDEPLVENSIEKYRVFDSVAEYSDWTSEQHEGNEEQNHLFFGDCSLAFRAFKAL